RGGLALAVAPPTTTPLWGARRRAPPPRARARPPPPPPPRKVFGPMDSPFGRFAAILDPQGAAFAVIDVRTTVGEMPEMV
ncbi:hypothetical protein ACFVZ9_24630, partial [Streptomyces zaomyceticus]